MENELLDKKFDDIDFKLDALIERCQSLESENSELKSKIASLELELDSKNQSEERYTEQQAVIRTKIDGLLAKLNTFSDAS